MGYKIKSFMCDLKYKIQRFRKGYCDLDQWNYDVWLLDYTSKIIRAWCKDMHSYPVYMENSKEWKRELLSVADDCDYLVEQIQGTTLNEESEDVINKKIEHITSFLKDNIRDMWD